MALPKNFLAGIPHLALHRHISGKNEEEDVQIVNLAGILIQCGYGAWDNTVMVEFLKIAEDSDNEGGIREVTQIMEERCRMLGLNKQESIGNDESESNVLDVGELSDEECRKNSGGITSGESLESLSSPGRSRRLPHQSVKHSTPLGSIASSLPSFPSLSSLLPSLHTSLSSSG